MIPVVGALVLAGSGLLCVVFCVFSIFWNYTRPVTVPGAHVTVRQWLAARWPAPAPAAPDAEASADAPAVDADGMFVWGELELGAAGSDGDGDSDSDGGGDGDGDDGDAARHRGAPRE